MLTHRGWDLASKGVGMNLEELELCKYTNLIDVSRKTVVVDIKLSETNESTAKSKESRA